MTNTEKKTPAEAAWVNFSTAPLIAAIGADRASFFAGYQTAEDALLAQNKRLREALTIYVNNDDVGARLSTPLYKTARAALNEKE